MPQKVTKTFTSPVIIASLADVINSLQAAPNVAISCNGASVYQLKFDPSDQAAPEITASTYGCQGVQVARGANPQPALWDPHDSLLLAASKVLPTSAAS
jgi:hypothetical protein